MPRPKPITLHGTPIAGGAMPVICAPLVGRTRDEVRAEMSAVLAKIGRAHV